MEAANPPTRDDLVGKWVYPVPASVEHIGYISYYLNSDGRIDGFEFGVNGDWSLEGTTFRVTPHPGLQLTDWPLDWSAEVKNLRIIFVEYDGKLYKACNFCNDMLYEPTLPLKYWGN
jgi:hypothetical protein